jgi:membrane peptidoglycan carboxypeptidase
MNKDNDNFYTNERIQGDLNYERAKVIADQMLQYGLITSSEYDKFMDITLKTFSPLFWEIFPHPLAMCSDQSDV